jgi:hypothetical protein
LAGAFFAGAAAFFAGAFFAAALAILILPLRDVDARISSDSKNMLTFAGNVDWQKEFCIAKFAYSLATVAINPQFPPVPMQLVNGSRRTAVSPT